jgi:hypothetical protein
LSLISSLPHFPRFLQLCCLLSQGPVESYQGELLIAKNHHLLLFSQDVDPNAARFSFQSEQAKENFLPLAQCCWSVHLFRPRHACFPYPGTHPWWLALPLSPAKKLQVRQDWELLASVAPLIAVEAEIVRLSTVEPGSFHTCKMRRDHAQKNDCDLKSRESWLYL